MHQLVYRVLTLLAELVAPLPVGTNLGLLHLLWMMLRGDLLATRGAVIPGVSALGLPEAAVRRSWRALGQGAWDSPRLLGRWAQLVQQEGQWQPHRQGGYQPVAVDLTGFWRPRLVGCPTTHYHTAAGKALPAIPLGLVARIGSVGGQRLGLPLALVRADPRDPRVSTQQRLLVRQAVACCGPEDLAVCDRGFGVALLQEEQCRAWVVRLRKDFTARRALPPAYGGRGRPPTRGALVRPLARSRKGRELAATPPDREERWEEAGVRIRAQVWTGLVLPQAAADCPSFTVMAIWDPRYAEPLLVATPTALGLTPREVRELYRDRWPVEQLPLAAKQMIGAARQFVHAAETCQRLPELTVIAGAVLSYVAATQPAVATGYWDRRPQRTPGRLRRVLARQEFPQGTLDLPERVRQKASVTGHLPKGNWGQRRKGMPGPTAPVTAPPPVPAPTAA